MDSDVRCAQTSPVSADRRRTAPSVHTVTGCPHRGIGRHRIVPVAGPGNAEALVPNRDEGLRGGWQGAGQRQRIDITRPATMAPNPMAKFHEFSEAMNGICSPAT
ncbi:hypothetical protein GCM10027300_19510 [Modestobacter lapidis]